jgi:colanic acid/amylovoran biosynthesis glycosyltransferase
MGFEGVRWMDFVKSTGTPLVTTFYGQDVSKLGRIPFWREKYTELFKYGSLFLAEGNNLRNELIKLGCPPEKVVVQHLGVDPLNYIPVKKEVNEYRKFKILQAASYKPKKGYHSALLTIKELLKTHKNFEFRIIGSGTKEEVEEMLTWVSELELSEHVKLLGALPHSKYREELATADIFFHPSVVAPDGDTEGGSPVGITEACAMGIPVVATLHADIPEVVIDGVTGRLAPEKDITTLAAHLAWFMDNSEKMVEFGAQGRERVEKEYNIHIQIKRLEMLYNDILKGSNPGI